MTRQQYLERAALALLRYEEDFVGQRATDARDLLLAIGDAQAAVGILRIANRADVRRVKPKIVRAAVTAYHHAVKRESA